MKIRSDKIHPTRRNAEMEVPAHVQPELPATSETELDLDRRSLFNPEYTSIARVMVEAGLRYSDLARAFNVALKTLKRWMKRYPEFGEAIIQAQDWFNTQLIEKALVRRATGYNYNEDTYEYKHSKQPDGSLKTTELLAKRVKKHVTASERSIEYYLNNRSRFVPDADGNPRWTHHNKLEVTGPGGNPLEITSINPEKFLAELIARQQSENDAVEAEFVEAKRIGVETHEEPHKEISS